MGHKLYGVSRRQEFVENITSLRKIGEEEKSGDKNREKYFDKVLGIINNENLHSLSNELMLNEYKILNVDKYPLLWSIGETGWIKGFEMFYSSLIHYGNVLNDKSFVKEYLMHRDGMNGRFFWGLNTENMKSSSGQCRLIENILKSDHIGVLKVM